MFQAELLTSLDLLKKGNFKPGVEMEKVHQMCQEHEGSRFHDWIHALVHRIEGDVANAAYWYRRAGTMQHSGSFEEEWRIIRNVAERN